MGVRRCPECGTVNRPTVPTCECGFVFDAQAVQALVTSGARHYHMHHLTLGWITIAGFVMLCLTCLMMFVLGSAIMAVPAAGSVALLVKGARMVSTSRRGLRSLAPAVGELPKARLLRG